MNKNGLKLSLFANTGIIVLSLSIIVLMAARIFGAEIQSALVVIIEISLVFLYLLQYEFELREAENENS